MDNEGESSSLDAQSKKLCLKKAKGFTSANKQTPSTLLFINLIFIYGFVCPGG
jgi:hypothetical protein